MNSSSTASTVEQRRNLFRSVKSAVFPMRYIHSQWFLCTLLISAMFFSGCSNDKPPQVEAEKVESGPRLTFENAQFEVDVETAFGTYYESLTSNPPRYRCSVGILNKTSHPIKNLVLVDCGSPAQTISFGGGQGSVFYSSADIRLDTPLQSGERRKISFEIEFDASNGGRIPPKEGPSVKSFTDTNGIIFYNTLKFPT